jgi:prokaryotic ubiquitin-like protein Pup
MPSQDRIQSKASKRDQPTDDVEVATVDSAHLSRADLDEDVDAILDEIDDLLEVNAEDFVKSFVQKGGQ